MSEKESHFTRVIKDKKHEEIIRYFFSEEGIKVDTDEETPNYLAYLNDKFPNHFQFNMDQIVKLQFIDDNNLQTQIYFQIQNRRAFFGAFVILYVNKEKKTIHCVHNNYVYYYKYKIEKAALSEEEILEITKEKLKEHFDEVHLNSLGYYLYRHEENVSDSVSLKENNEVDNYLNKIQIFPQLIGDESLIVPVRAVVMEPYIVVLDVFVEAISGNLIQIQNLTSYVTGKGQIFAPDPVIVGGTNINTIESGELRPSDDFYKLLQHNVTLNHLNDAERDHFYLKGSYCDIVDIPLGLRSEHKVSESEGSKPDFSFTRDEFNKYENQ
ncbi:MAG: hypothetical protein FK733_16340, partial [Asgard group archaeon]|nr:hypothetical protein [Asgard group archaeon]